MTTPFSPMEKNVTFLSPDGLTPISIPISSIDSWKTLVLTSSISYAVQIGAASAMLLTVAVITSSAKYRTPIFWTTTASLILSIITNSLLLSFYTSAWTEFYIWFAYDTALVPTSTVATNIVANTFSPLFLFAIEVSLLIQTEVICGTMRDRYRWITLVVSFLVASVAVGFNFGQMVMSNIVTLNQSYYENPAWSWIGHAVLGTYTFSLWYFCVIFCVKLALTLWKRKQMGMKPWGPMRILCIMSGCTMIIPSIFSALEFDTELQWEPSSISHTLVALMLPLSSIWAAASIEGNPAESFDIHARRKQIFGSFASDKLPIHPSSTANNNNTNNNEGRSIPLNPTSKFGGPREEREGKGNGGVQGRRKTKVESIKGFFGGGGGGGLGGVEGNQVRVERTYEVRRSGSGLGGVGRD